MTRLYSKAPQQLPLPGFSLPPRLPRTGVNLVRTPDYEAERWAAVHAAIEARFERTGAIESKVVAS